VFNECSAVGGFHPLEQDQLGPFVWSEQNFRLQLSRPAPFLLLTVCYLGDRGTLTIRSPMNQLDWAPLCRGWHVCALRTTGAAAGEILELSVDPLISVEGETRQLGLMCRRIEVSDDERLCELTRASQRNLGLNQREYLAGKILLESVPPLLRINLETRCNIPETSQACVYCAWDWGKAAERNSLAFTLNTLDELGEFYHSAVAINDCSIGEPTMNKHFGSIISQIDRDGKHISLTTNGQLLSLKRRQEILGKNLDVYVSVDSATAEGYTRYRNDRFDDLIENVKALCTEKKQHENLPRVFVSFILMRSNIHELPSFFSLMRDVGVDEIKLRMLYLDENVNDVTMNNGYRFHYAEELLSADELEPVNPLVRELSAAHQIPVYVESERFPQDVHLPGAPLCNEPWQTLYMLRRGIMPCCYATEPIARWDEQRDRPLEEFLREVFNGPAYQEIRTELAAGRLAEYCLNTPSCPILRQKQQQGQFDAPLNSFQRKVLSLPDGASPAPLPMVPLENLTRQFHATASAL